MSRNRIIKIIEDLACNSEHLRLLAKVQKEPSVFFSVSLRQLKRGEVKKLEKEGNRAEDWRKILVSEDFTPSNIRNNYFAGDCVIEPPGNRRLEITPGCDHMCGLYNNTISDSMIMGEVLVKNTGLLHNYIVFSGTVLLNNQEISAKGECTFGGQLDIPIGDETGSRTIPLYQEISVPVARALCLACGDENLFHQYNELIALYRQKSKSPMGIIHNNCLVKNSSLIRDTFLGAYTLINGSSFIENSTCLSNKEERVKIEGANFVKNSTLQWGVSLENHCTVENSVFTEHSHGERHGKVVSSIIGPNTGIAEGEVTSSLVGPFVGFHHQSLLIGAFWPEGKGNIAYGANVGSNHTAKAPDQEIWCGEGTFFGLGVNIKFPSNFINAPFSIIASGVTTLPQKVNFPFSLINFPLMPPSGLPSGLNEICPGWVLSDNLYLLFRNEAKYKTRNKARRSEFEYSAFRPDIASKILDARESLKSINEEKDLYTEKEIPGLGKNILTEKNRLKGIEAYTFYIHFFILSGLFNRIEAKGIDTALDKKAFFGLKSSSSLWEYQKELLIEEGWAQTSIPLLLEKYKVILMDIEGNLIKSKGRDDKKGMAIIDDYKLVHTLAGNDAFILEKKEEIKGFINRIHEYLEKLK